MNYLAIDTSSDICSVSVFLNGNAETLEQKNVKEHSEYMPPFCKKLLGDNLSKKIDFIALSIGPGSYAGLKTSSSFAKGLSMAINKPIIPVETFKGMNLSIKNEDKYFIAIYSHRDFAFYQFYNGDGPLSKYVCGKISNMKDHSIFGYGFKNCEQSIEYSEITPSSKNIGMIANRNYNNLLVEDINNISPVLLSMEK